MINKIIISLLACALYGCAYPGTKLARTEPFPEMPKNPDGICPDLSGTYEVFGIHQEAGQKDRTHRMPVYGKTIEENPGETDRPPNYQYVVIFRTPENYTKTAFYNNDGLVEYYVNDDINQPDSDSGITVKCDKNIIYAEDKRMIYGDLESSSNFYHAIYKTFKNPDGTIQMDFYRKQRFYMFFATVPTVGSYVVRRYIYKPYTSKN